MNRKIFYTLGGLVAVVLGILVIQRTMFNSLVDSQALQADITKAPIGTSRFSVKTTIDTSPISEVPIDDVQSVQLPVKPKFPITKTNVFLIGGFDHYGGNLYNDVYSSPDGTTWNLISPQDVTAQNKFTPSFGFGYNTIFFQNKIWKISGGTNAGVINKVWSSPDGVTWTHVGTIPMNLCAGNSFPVVFQGKIVVLFDECYTGGGSGVSMLWSSSNGVTWTQIDTDSTTAGTQNPTWGQRMRPSFTVFNNKLWVMGGSYYSGNMLVTRNDIWSSVNGATWTHVDTDSNTAGIQDAPWVTREQHTALVFNNKLFILGGVSKDINNYHKTVDDIWQSTDGIHWTVTLADAPWATHQIGPNASQKGIRYGHSSFVLGNKMFLIGGEKPDSGCNISCSTTVSNDIWSSPDGVNWTEVTPTGSVPQLRKWHATVVMSGNNFSQ